MPNARHKRRHSARLRRLALPFAGVGAAAGAAVGATTLTAAPAPTAAIASLSPAPFDVGELREDAAAGPDRGDNGAPSPLAGSVGTPSATPAPTPSAPVTAAPAPAPTAVAPVPTPTPTPAGFPPVAGCDATIPDDDIGNGELGSDHLCGIGSGQQLRPDAAASFVALDAFYRAETGEGLIECVTDSYRSYEAQVDVADRKPGLAAEPGTSQHGWGLAVDVGCGANSFGGELYAWLDDNAGDFGWDNPDWARPSGSTPEPWHWEFAPES
ncbi:M15 family metallopeptidase [Jiangella alkaliphila]|uniref:D-alanyl-D-alanine carboxypeptidase n=1 Tax=Jiangella alkaliphila TaxID=419479 RepID=A0A1H2FT09_9ACTN|nr:M15 family metallopeptidase [Jiangella alkaliphila]SDU10493.1 D-alanyl-D-alanine carboxypeptidase [Jiangella alkaliphila]